MTHIDSVQAHRLQKPKNIVFSLLNISSVRYKTAAFEKLIRNTIDICLPFQTKLDEGLIYKKLSRWDRSKCQYENDSLIRNFNLNVENKNFEVFMNSFNLE